MGSISVRMDNLKKKTTPINFEEVQFQMTISVVIPAFNAEKYIAETLQSVCAQELQPLEIIVIDDGSSDRTADVVRNFSPLIKYYRQENTGPAAARNKGIQLAAGTHVAFLDADDRWLSNHLANLQLAFSSFAIKWCATAYAIQICGDPAQEIQRFLPGVEIGRPSLLKDYFIACSQTWRVWTSACAVERSLLLEHGGFDTQLHIGEDIDLWFRLALAEPSLGYCPSPSAVYRRVPDSLMHQTWVSERRFFNELHRMKAQAKEKGTEAVAQVRPLLVRNANAAAWVAGRTSDRETAFRLIRGNSNLLKPRNWLRLVLSLVLPARLNRILWTLRKNT